MCRYRGIVRLRYWKPIQTGVEPTTTRPKSGVWLAAPNSEIFAQGVRLPKPVSPHLAAQWSGMTNRSCELTAMRRDDGAAWIVEGAGGVLVPVNESEMMAHLMERLGLPVVVVARTALGTINHTLLTIEALRARRWVSRAW